MNDDVDELIDSLDDDDDDWEADEATAASERSNNVIRGLRARNKSLKRQLKEASAIGERMDRLEEMLQQAPQPVPGPSMGPPTVGGQPSGAARIPASELEAQYKRGELTAAQIAAAVRDGRVAWSNPKEVESALAEDLAGGPLGRRKRGY